MNLQSILTCPACAHKKIETMPTCACQFFYDSEGCGLRLKPKPATAASFVPTGLFHALRFKRREHAVRDLMLFGLSSSPLTLSARRHQRGPW